MQDQDTVGGAGKRPPRRQQKEYGQGLVEYVVIIALVGLGVVVAGAWLGPAVNRLFGIVTGALGTSYNSVDPGHTIVIEQAECIAVHYTNGNPDVTGLWVTGSTDEPVDQLVGSTNLAVGTGMNGGLRPVESNGPGTFKWDATLSDQGADLSICPKSVVIQATDGAMALSPISQVTMTCNDQGCS